MTATTTEVKIDAEFVSPYQLIKVLNEVSGLNLPTQMGYNYAKKGMIKVTKNSTGKLQVAKADAVEWIQKQLETRAAKTVEA